MTCQPDESSEQENPAGDVQAPQESVSSPKVSGLSSSACLLHQKQPKREDKDHIHAIRHAVLSRHLLEALVRLGENKRSLRRIERQFLVELKPSGFAAEMLFGGQPHAV